MEGGAAPLGAPQPDPFLFSCLVLVEGSALLLPPPLPALFLIATCLQGAGAGAGDPNRGTHGRFLPQHPSPNTAGLPLITPGPINTPRLMIYTPTLQHQHLPGSSSQGTEALTGAGTTKGGWQWCAETPVCRDPGSAILLPPRLPWPSSSIFEELPGSAFALGR